MFKNKQLEKTWILVNCGDKKFAVNSTFICNTENFKNAEALRVPATAGIKRGVYKVSDLDIIVLDGRKLLGEKSITTKRMKFIEDIHKYKNELLKWSDDLEWAILDSKSDVELDSTKLEFNTWLDTKTSSKDINDIKEKIKMHYNELFIIANNIMESKQKENYDVKDSLKKLDKIRQNIEKLIAKQLGKIISIHNNSFEETCLVFKHNNRIYGVTVDNIVAVTENVDVKALYSEYKIIAGKCMYKDEQYNVFNVNYITDVAKKLE